MEQLRPLQRRSARAAHSSHVVHVGAHAAVHNTPHSPCSNKGPPYPDELPKLAPAYSPINVTNLALKLRDYPLRQQAQELEEGFRFGFRLGFIGERVEQKSKNLSTVFDLKAETREKINKEVLKGRVAGPFESIPLKNFRSSPIGLVPKKLPGEYRMIHHLSWPKGTSVNDQIDPEMCSVKYASFDDAVTIVKQSGKNCDMAKCDVKSAFRLLPIHPDDYDLVGFTFDNKYYYDMCMPMGASVSCSTWVKFSSFLEWLLKSSSPRGRTMHYLDDTLFVGQEGTQDCLTLMNNFHELCHYLGVPIAPEKTEGPKKVLIFLGLQLDSVRQTVTIPLEKLLEIKEKIKTVMHMNKVSLQQLQSLIGSLNFACRAVAPGRAFLRRLIGATIALKKSHHITRVTASMKADLSMWLTFLRDHNGVSVFRDQFWTSNHDMELFTDAAGSIGLGIYFQGKWAQAKWGEHFKRESESNNITFLELFPILVALHLFGDSFQNKKVLFHCDNMAVVEIINKQTSKCPRVMDLLRPLVLQSMKLNTIIRAKHIKGENNTIADAISRYYMQIFRKLAPQADRQPTAIPQFLWQL